MSRVTQETLEKLSNFLDSLDPEVKGKCALCNETLTHIVKLAEVQTGAGTATVTRALAARVNEGAAPGDVVSGEALKERVRQREGLNNSKIRNPDNKPNDQPKQKEAPAPFKEPLGVFETNDQPQEKNDNASVPGQSTASQFSRMAISQLRQIRRDDQKRKKALIEVRSYIDKQLLVEV
jgi:hypothetical protein